MKLIWLSACAVMSLCLPALASPKTWLRQESEPPALLKGVHKLVCLGDSITQVGDGPGGYVWLVRHYLDAVYPDLHIETVNAGISGNKSTDMIARFQRDVLDQHPELLTISVGVNDVWHGFYDNHPMGDGPRGVPLEEYKKNVDSMVSQALAAGIKVVILSTTVIYEDLGNRENAKAAKYNEALHEVARRHDCPFIDFQKPFRTLIKTYQSVTGGRDNFLTVDGVHMNAEGNKVMAHVILTGFGISPDAQKAAGKQVANEQSGRR